MTITPDRFLILSGLQLSSSIPDRKETCQETFTFCVNHVSITPDKFLILTGLQLSSSITDRKEACQETIFYRYEIPSALAVVHQNDEYYFRNLTEDIWQYLWQNR